MNNKVLIVEDEKQLSKVMSLYLNREGYIVTIANDGYEGEYYIDNEIFDLYILDVMLPDKDGWSLLRKIRAKGSSPVILTTARGDEDDRVFGLELGADDYMVKPISMRELVIRCKLRINKKRTTSYITSGSLKISEDTHIISEDNVEINLTPKEFDLLLFLIKNKNIVFKREQLLNSVWDYEYEGDSRTVDTHIKNLREKIDYCSKNIKTIWGVGYKMEDKDE